MIELDALFVKVPSTRNQILRIVTQTTKTLTVALPEVDLDPSDLATSGVAKLYLSAGSLFNSPAFVITGTWGTTGVTLPVGADITAGMYAFGLQCIGTTEATKYLSRGYLEATPGPNDSRAYQGISIQDVRMAMWDFNPEDNILLDDLNYSDEMIASAIRRAVDLWNDIPPDVASYSPATFPFRSKHLQCVCGLLLSMWAQRELRNAIQYSGGGTAVQNDKAGAYLSVAKDKLAEFEDWAKRKKIEINLNGSAGSLLGEYGSLYA